MLMKISGVRLRDRNEMSSKYKYLNWIWCSEIERVTKWIIWTMAFIMTLQIFRQQFPKQHDFGIIIKDKQNTNHLHTNFKILLMMESWMIFIINFSSSIEF